MPTQFNSSIYAGDAPEVDAVAVAITGDDEFLLAVMRDESRAEFFGVGVDVAGGVRISGSYR